MDKISMKIQENWAGRNFVTVSSVNSLLIMHEEMQRWIWNLQLLMNSTGIPGCDLVAPGGLFDLTFATRQLENRSFPIGITCWAPWILQLQSTELPSYFLEYSLGMEIK